MAFRMSEQPRTIKIYNLLAGTNEFIGEGDAYIPPHTGLPANSTDAFLIVNAHQFLTEAIVHNSIAKNCGSV